MTRKGGDRHAKSRDDKFVDSRLLISGMTLGGELKVINMRF